MITQPSSPTTELKKTDITAAVSAKFIEKYNRSRKTEAVHPSAKYKKIGVLAIWLGYKVKNRKIR